MNLRKLGEDRLLQKIAADLQSKPSVLSGVGDDCAVARFLGSDKLLLLKTDCVVAGVHFDPRTRPSVIGWKAMARPLSDFAAMSGLPEFALVTFIAPPTTRVDWTTEVYRGLEKAARTFDLAIVGGETSRTAGPVTISISIAGRVEKNRWVSRRGGKSGDALFVTGRLGGSLRGKHLRFIPRIAESRWLTRHFRINAMMDLSDGLGADLPRLARASGVGFEIDERALPRTRGRSVKQAISDGEDYELLFAISEHRTAALVKAWKRKFPTLPLTRIGRLVSKSKIRNLRLPAGYAHF
jgi:thiamine-monophosphate kinase